MNAPTPLILDGIRHVELGGSGDLVSRYSDHDADGTEHFLLLSWEDDHKGRWSKEKQITLGKTGDADQFRWWGPMGRYRTRQYQLVLECAGQVGVFGLEDQVVGLGD